MQLLRQWSPDVTYVTNAGELADDAFAALSARGIVVERRAVAGVEAHDDGRLRGIRFADGDLVEVDSVFLGPRFVPNDALLRGLGAAASTVEGFGDGSWVEVDGMGRTSVPGVWAAGNVVNPGASVPVAAGAGNLVGTAINGDLIEEEIRDALAAAVTSPALTPRS